MPADVDANGDLAVRLRPGLYSIAVALPSGKTTRGSLEIDRLGDPTVILIALDRAGAFVYARTALAELD